MLSDRVPNCILEAMERQDWFKLLVDTKALVETFGTRNVPVNAGLLKHMYPVIAEKYGESQELALEIEPRMPRVKFGTTDRDMIFETTIKLGVHLEGDPNYILYDEFDLYIE